MTSLEEVEMLRGLEMRARSCGLFEQANAVRMLADNLEQGYPGRDTVFDSGVFDKHGPPDEGDLPYLVEQSPRLNPSIARVRRGC